MSSPQVTAKMGLDPRGIKLGTAEVGREFESLGRKIRASMASSLRGLGTLVGGAITTAIGGALTKGLKDGMQQAFSMEGAEVMMKGTLGSLEKAKKAMEMVRAEVEKNPMFSKSELADSAKSLSSFADGSVEKLRGLLDTAKKISILKPEQGIAGASYALKEALSGNYVSLISRFDLDKGSIEKYKAQGLEGKAVLDAVLKAQGITDALLQDMAGTAQSQLQSLLNQMANIGEMFFNSIWPELEPQVKAMQEWMKANGQEVVESLKVIAALVAGIGQILKGAGSWWDKGTQWVADQTVGPDGFANKFDLVNDFWQSVGQGAPVGESLGTFYNSARGAQLGARGRQLEGEVAGRVADADKRMAAARAPHGGIASLTVNVTGNGITPQMSTS